MRVLVLPGLDGGEAPRLPLVRALPPPLAGEVVAYPRERLMGYDALLGWAARRIESPGEPVVLVGESFSGPLAVRAAAAHAGVVRGVVLVATFAHRPVPGWLRFVATSLTFRLPPPRAFLRQWLLGPDASDDEVDVLRREIMAVRPAVMAHRVREALTVDVREELAALTVPVMVVEASRDRVLGRRRRRALWQVRPSLRWEVVDAPHLVIEREPARVAELVSDFAASLA